MGQHLESEASRVAHERARVAADLAEQVLAPSGLRLDGNAHHLAAALFIESIGWALRAFETLRKSTGQAAIAFEGPPRADELEHLFETCEVVLLQAVPDRHGLEKLRAHALRREFESTLRPAAETEQAARTLSQVARRLLESLAAAQGSVDAPALRRTARVVALLVLLAGASMVFGVLREQLERRGDLAAGKPWLASSSYEKVCQSPQHRCSSHTRYFFHTREEPSPWLEVDLGHAQQFSRVHVLNRRDCCAERAAPLVVEVSSDRLAWREVVRNHEVFDDWRGAFAPVTARWVRFRVARQSMLHLRDVRVLR